MAARVLVVDDEEALRELVAHHLRRAGFDVAVCEDGGEALALALEQDFDLIVLDVLLPGLDGVSVCRTLRERGYRGPILMLTALDDETDRVVGLEVGADDYVTKPFSPRELVARVRALLRRAAWEAERGTGDRRAVGPLELDLAARTASVRGTRLDLTPTEYRLLSTLAAEPGRTFSRHELLDRVWGEDYVGDPRVVDVHISHLRQKLECAGAGGLLETLRGFGWRLRAREGAGP